MVTSPYRIHIKRGRPVSTTSGAADFLRTHDKISPLLPTIQRNLSLQKDCAAVLPSIFESCEVMQLAEGLLSLSAPNAALASKLKQQCPKLQTSLQERGWQINAIRIKVQVKRVIAKPAPSKQITLSTRALSAFQDLQNNMSDDRQNAELKQALQKLITRHSQKNHSP